MPGVSSTANDQTTPFTSAIRMSGSTEAAVQGLCGNDQFAPFGEQRVNGDFYRDLARRTNLDGLVAYFYHRKN